MISFDEIKKWKALDKMDNATEEVYAERIFGAYNVVLPHGKLVLIPYIGEKEKVLYEYPELVALCPVTFLLDVYTIKITMIPGNYIPELKSLKFHFLDYKDLPISHEHLASRVYRDIYSQVNPEKMHIELIANVRGGILSTVNIGKL